MSWNLGQYLKIHGNMRRKAKKIRKIARRVRKTIQIKSKKQTKPKRKETERRRRNRSEKGKGKKWRCDQKIQKIKGREGKNDDLRRYEYKYNIDLY